MLLGFVVLLIVISVDNCRFQEF